MAERFIRNEQVRGSIPRAGSEKVSSFLSINVRLFMNIIGGVIWHYWLAVPLVVVGVVSLIAALIGYVGKVSSTRYPKR